MFNPLIAALERLAGALSDPARREYAIAGMLTVYTAVWTLFALVSKAPQAIHADSAEIAILGRALEWGSAKHPAGLPALAHGWFSIFPQTDFFYHLLAVSMASVAIYVTWHLAGLWLDREKRAAVPFLLMLIPSYNFLCLKFEHNTASTAAWALATYTFMRSFQSRGLLWSVAAGVAAAIALMTKYWSIVLLGGLGFAALLDRRRLAYIKSPAPWVAVAVAVICLMPHLTWLYQNHFASLAHAVRFPAAPLGTQVLNLLKFAVSPAAYLAVPTAVFAMLARPAPAALRDIAEPSDDHRRLALIAFLAPFGVAVAGAAAVQLKLGTLWTASMLTLFPIVLLSSPLVDVSRREVAGFAAVALAVGIGALAIAPAVAIVTLRSGGEYDTTHMRMLSAETDRAWRETTTRPIRLVAGPQAHANVVAFYLPDRPLAFALFPRPTEKLVIDPNIARDGFVVVCPALDNYCSDALLGLSPNGRPTLRREVELTPTLWGFSGVPRRFTISVFAPSP